MAATLRPSASVRLCHDESDVAREGDVTYRTLIGVLVLLRCLMPSSAEACTRVVYLHGVLPKPQPSWVALSGLVTGYVESVRGEHRKALARGLTVQVDTGTGGRPQEMHWYPMETFDDCSDRAWMMDDLVEHYPVGARVVAVGAITRGNGDVREIESYAGDFGHIAVVATRALPEAGEFEFGRARESSERVQTRHRTRQQHGQPNSNGTTKNTNSIAPCC
jgi:hypothetical protein